MRTRRVSIADIAKHVGVSYSTVSRALQNSDLISSQRRAEIKQIAQELGYVPDAIAKSLQSQRTNTIGLVVTSISDPYFGQLVQGIEKFAKSKKVNILLSASHKNIDELNSIIANFYSYRVDGILIADGRISQEDTQFLRGINVPMVLINTAESEGFPSVVIDDQVGGKRAVEHLIGLGHRSIAYWGAGDNSRADIQRKAGYEEALKKEGIGCNPDWAVEMNTLHKKEKKENDFRIKPSRLRKLFYKTDITAIFCFNDMIAIGVLEACKKFGIQVPKHLSVVGYDNIPMCEYVTPNLTTIDQKIENLGDKAMTMLFDLIDDQKTVKNQVFLPQLKKRHSTASPLSIKK